MATININSTGAIVESSVTVRPNDSITWLSVCPTLVLLYFQQNSWPFTQQFTSPIQVPANGSTDPYTIAATARGPYGYSDPDDDQSTNPVIIVTSGQ
jgi:hypothetical protein